MINKLSEQWNRLEERVGGVTSGESQEAEGLLGQVASVREILQKMCEVSVTRTSLKEAIREALLPIVRQYRDELFPELVELRRRLEASGEDPAALDVYRGESPRLADDVAVRLEGFEQRISELAASIDQRITQEQLAGSETRQDHRLQEVQEYLGRLEASVPKTAEVVAGEVESRLRKEIESMVEQLTGKLSEVQETLGRIEEFVPRREALEALERRLASLEGVLERAVAPEVRGLHERFAGLRQNIQEASQVLERTTGEVREALGRQLVELRTALHDGISRWESDQSQMHERLTSLRDTLRDQLGRLDDEVSKGKASLWGKLTKKEKGLKLSPEDFDDLSGKLEGIVSGLESIIARRK